MSDPLTMSKDEVLAAFEECVQYTYGRIPLVFVRGEGAYMWDSEGKRYLDWVSGGRAGTALGHQHPHVVAALKKQIEQLIFVSNDFYHPWGARLGQLLAERSGGRKGFFCNSGTEATETALKLARKWGHEQRGDDCFEIITFERSFHGRTFGAITATAQTQYQTAFRPVVPGFTYLPFNDLPALERTVSAKTAAVYLEPIQGEGGTYPATPEFMQGVERLCAERNVLCMVDEVQTGFGRTGRFWAYENYGVEPDVIATAKALGGGLPIGVTLAKPEKCALVPGDHGCTFGGNPLSAAAAVAAIEALDGGDYLANAAAQGEHLMSVMRGWQQRWPQITDVRGIGLMIALEFSTGPAREVMTRCLDAGLIVHTVGDAILRLLPPVILTRAQADAGLSLLEGVLSDVL